MIFYIYSPSGVRIGLLQNAESVQWLENYQSPGEAKITADITDENLELLIEGNRIYNPDTGTAMTIRASDTQERTGSQGMVVRATSASARLDDRIVMATEKITVAEAGIYNLYSKNRRELPIECAAVKGYTNKVDIEITWKSCLEAISKTAEASDLGYRVNFDPLTAVETLEVYSGVDRTEEGSDDYVGYFGTDVGNVSNIRIITDDSDYKNVVIVAGEGEGAERRVRVVSIAAAGEERREMFVDARDLQSKFSVAKDTGEKDSNGNPVHEYEEKTYTDDEYNEMLENRGREKLKEHLRQYDVSCEAEQSNIIFGADYFLGDRLPVKLPRYKISTSAVVSAVKLVYEAGGKTVTAILSKFAKEE